VLRGGRVSARRFLRALVNGTKKILFRKPHVKSPFEKQDSTNGFFNPMAV
jgi:hypothetical protein